MIINNKFNYKRIIHVPRETWIINSFFLYILIIIFSIFEINNKISNLENRVKLLEQKIGNSSNVYQDDNSLYMI